jgi:hypothetical protein
VAPIQRKRDVYVAVSIEVARDHFARVTTGRESARRDPERSSGLVPGDYLDRIRVGARYDDVGWERLSSSYELPWREDGSGQSLSGSSRIREGVYKFDLREDGPKGWRLELKGTGHRRNIQVHRAHRSMYIEGCILPVDFTDFRNIPAGGVGPIELLQKGDLKIELRSKMLMNKIRERYAQLKRLQEGAATLTIAATLPAIAPQARQSSVV